MNWLRSWFRPIQATGDTVTPTGARVNAYGIGPGDDIVISCDARAEEDAIALIGAVQREFPSNRVHLLMGFGPVQVSRKNCRAQCEGACQESKQEISIEQDAEQARAQSLQSGDERNVVLLRHCSGGRVIAISVPPKQESEPVSETNCHGQFSQRKDAPPIAEKAGV